MRVHGPTSELSPNARGAAVALGNFDGVHLGHQAVIASARTIAAKLNAPLGVAVFTPHPRRFFAPETPPFRLQTPAQRERALAALGVCELYEIGFDAALSQSTDREFAERVLRDRLGAQHVSVGADFRFGRGRMGDAARLHELGSELGFSVAAVAPVQGGDAKVSSSAVRDAIAAGDVRGAAALLGRPWAIEGEVQRGFERGRGFGFATANVGLGDYMRPRLGIYAVRVSIDGVRHNGVASIGVNPTVGALPEPLLEAHLFDFDGDLYGRTIEVELVAFLRDELKFDDVEALKAQMTRDAANARSALA